jgi:transcriptional regulator with XRE-family HTH domain
MRKISRLSQPEFAAHLGISAKVVKEIERGVGNPTIGSLNRIGQFFGLEVAFVRSEKLRVRLDQTVAATSDPAVASVKFDSPRSAIEDARRIFDELEQIKKRVVPPKQLTDTLKSMEENLSLIHQAKNIAEQGIRPLAKPLMDLERVARGIDTELQAVKEAQEIIDTAEKIQRQLQPPPAVKQWLADIEAANKLLNPLDDPSKRILENLKKN